MKICNASGVGICVNCNGIPPATDGYNYGDVCRKTTQKIMDEIEIYAEKHDSAKSIGSEYIWQDDEAQVDAIELVGKIFDLFTEEVVEEGEEE